jgi:hypothetical protein
MGRDGDNELNLIDRHANLERSILFNRLLRSEWYKTLFKERYSELNERDKLYINLLENINTLSDLILEKANRNFELWPINSELYYDNNGFQEEIEILNKYLTIRQPWVDAYIDSL